MLKAGPSPIAGKGGIRISLFPMSGKLDTREVRTATQYVILSHLVRNLVHYNSIGDIEGDLASSWTISPDFRSYEFRLVTDALFSDGTPITASDVLRTFHAQMKTRITTHFDFGQVQSIEAIASDTIRIVLKSRNPNFLLQMVHPEFGVLYRSDAESQSRAPSFNPASGPYFLVSASPTKYVLQRNPFYPHFAMDAPQSLTFEYLSTDQQVAELKAGTVDFSIPFDLKSFESFQARLAGSPIFYTIPHIGFTYWLTLNPHSAALRDPRARNRIQSILHRYTYHDMPPSGIPWTRAEQLYLPDGVGRPTPEQLRMAWENVDRNAKMAPPPAPIRVLTSSLFPFNEDLRSALQEAGIHATIDHYDVIDDVASSIKAGHYDAFLINNDFSSVDLLENIMTTFNGADPLIFLPSPDHSIARWLSQANSMHAGEQRDALFQKISLSTLEDGLVAPICYRRVAFLHQKSLDISAWSAVFPEIAFWKARLVTP